METIKYTTYEEALEAVKKCGRAIYYVPDEFKDRELCLEAVKKYNFAIHYIPDKLKNKEICLIAVKRDGWVLEYVPKHLQTVEMIHLSLDYNLDNIKYVDLKRFPHFEQYVEVRKL